MSKSLADGGEKVVMTTKSLDREIKHENMFGYQMVQKQFYLFFLNSFKE